MVGVLLEAVLRVVVGTAGRVYAELEGGQVRRAEVAFACGWLVPDPGPGPDAPPEAWECWGEMAAEAGPGGLVVECGAPAVTFEDGWECAHGHRHYTYGSDAQQALEAQEWMIERSNAHSIDKEEAIARLYA